MAWSKAQKATAAIACKAAKIDDAQRRDLILRNFANARHHGVFTSTSPKLTEADFEQFMAVVEGFAGGTLPTFERGRWHRVAGERATRLRNRVTRIDAAMRAAGIFRADSLDRWIAKRVPGAGGLTLAGLDYHGTLTVMLGLQSFARQKGVTFDAADAVDGEPADPHADAAASAAAAASLDDASTDPATHGTDAAAPEATTEGTPDHAQPLTR